MSYFREKVHQAVGQLLWPAEDEEAGHALLALQRIKPEHEQQVTDEDALLWWGKVKPFLTFDGSAFEHAQRLTRDQKAEFSNALWQLLSTLQS